jgi:predicted DNA binding protein
MWITKLQLQHNDCPIVSRCKKYNLLVFSYPSTWYKKNNNKLATTTCYFQSENKNKKELFIKDLKADKRITNLEVSKDIFTYEINLKKQGEHVMLYHTKEIFFIKPTINHFDGYEYWEVASWTKETLQSFIKELKNHMNICNIQKIEKSPLTDIYFPNIMPKISIKQKQALGLAYLHGYYSYPRKVTLEKLAKLAKIGTSTFQEHLRKAEIKLLPVIIEQQIKSEHIR